MLLDLLPKVRFVCPGDLTESNGKSYALPLCAISFSMNNQSINKINH